MHVALRGLACDAEFAGNASAAPAQLCECSDLSHDFRIDHRHLDALGWLVLQSLCVHVTLDAGKAGGRGDYF